MAKNLYAELYNNMKAYVNVPCHLGAVYSFYSFLCFYLFVSIKNSKFAGKKMQEGYGNHYFTSNSVHSIPD
jgi:hypothetical protein